MKMGAMSLEGFDGPVLGFVSDGTGGIVLAYEQGRVTPWIVSRVTGGDRHSGHYFSEYDEALRFFANSVDELSGLKRSTLAKDLYELSKVLNCLDPEEPSVKEWLPQLRAVEARLKEIVA